ncbi:MAG: hypothetical protein JSV88_29330 [Candidatus Aminicenantes bacterium]|nr:MAG: hypothetical protein JSV88_29330 [Candidatus Aminicenantes bacterium]
MFFREISVFECKRLSIRRNIIILVVLFILLAFFCWDGIGDYKKIVANKKPFQKMEREKVSLHLHYTFYGVRGIRFLFIPSPLSVIFNDSAVFDGMISHVDSAEKLDISNSFKGKDLFSDSGGFMDFAGIMFLISCFIALLYGWEGTRNPEYLKFISDISGCRKPGFFITLARLILLNLVFWILSGLALVWMLINGINAATTFYLVYVLVITLVITSFVTAGAIIGSFKSKVAQFITMPVLYFLLVLVIPWLIHRGVYMEAKEGIKSIYEFEYQTFKYIMDFEKRGYKAVNVWKSGDVAPDDIKSMIQSGQEVEYKRLREAELKRIEGIVKRIRVYQTLASFFPTTFYISTNKELSSKGFQNFIAFYRYSYDKKQDFIKFYIDRKFYRPLPKNGVEPFIKENEDLFYGKSQLPKSFYLGLILTVVYIAVLLLILYRMQTKGKGIKEEQVKTARVDFKKGNSFFALCKDQRVKSDIFRYYQEQKTAACIDKIVVNFRINEVRPDVVLKFLCRLGRASEEKAIEYLSILGIKDVSSLKLSYEEILKFYAAVKIGKNDTDTKYIIMDDFFKQKSREFEEDFFKLLSTQEASGCKILYLSCNMYYPKKSLDDDITLKTFCLFPLPMDEVTLR